MSDLFGEQVIVVAHPKAYAAAPGSGPVDKRCKDCDFYWSGSYRNGTYRKCNLVKSTHGAGTDIKANSPACIRFKNVEIAA